MNRSYSPSQRKANSETTRTGRDSLTGTRKQVLIIRNKVEAESLKPVTRSVTQQARPGSLHKAPSTSGRVPHPTKTARTKKEVAVNPNPSIIKDKPSVTRSNAFKPAKSRTIVATTQNGVESTAAIPKWRGRPSGSSSTVPRTSSDNPSTPPLGQVDLSLN